MAYLLKKIFIVTSVNLNSKNNKFLYKMKIDTPRYNQPDLLLLSACTIFAKQIK